MASDQRRELRFGQTRFAIADMKAAIWIVIGIFAGYIVWWIVPQYFGPEADPRSAVRLSRIAAEINRSVPVMIDKETELMPVVGAEAMLIYNYRLVDYEAAGIDHVKFAKGARERVTQGACNRPETRDDFLKKGVTLRYSYFDKNKQHVATVDVTPADCGF